MAAKLIDVRQQGRQYIDRYELVGEIASGGMATVFLARLTGVGGFQRFVAVKRLHPHLAKEREFVEMFLDEARLAAGIHHPNVVPILEVGTGDNGYYLVMEYIEGDTLARLLARAVANSERLPSSIVLRIALDMLLGLHAAHELKDELGAPTNLVHRDVSPQNVLVGTDGVARITDFGVARAASRLSGTRVGQLKGKIAYMAPEQAIGSSETDRRADVFAAGIVIWEALAGQRLFKADNEAATLSRILTEPIPRPPVSMGVNDQVVSAVMKALDRQLNRRFATCASFAEALEAAQTAQCSIATPRELAQFVTNAIGGELAQQRESVRLWIAQSESGRRQVLRIPGAPSSSVSAGAMSVPSGSRPSLPTLPEPFDPPGALPRRSRAPMLLALLVVIISATALWIFKRQIAELSNPVPAAPGPAEAATAFDTDAPKPEGEADEPAGAKLRPKADEPERRSSRPEADNPPRLEPVGASQKSAASEVDSQPDADELAPERSVSKARPRKRERKKQQEVDLTNPYR